MQFAFVWYFHSLFSERQSQVLHRQCYGTKIRITEVIDDGLERGAAVCSHYLFRNVVEVTDSTLALPQLQTVREEKPKLQRPKYYQENMYEQFSL